MTSNPVDLKEKFMVEVENPYNIWTFETIEAKTWKNESTGEVDEIPTLHDFIKSDAGGGAQTANVHDSDLGKDRLVPPQKKQSLRPLPKKEEFEEKPVEIAAPSADPAEKVQEMPKNAEISEDKETFEESVISERKVSPKQNKKVNPADPVAILVDTCKKHSTEIPLTLTIELPIKTLYYIANNEFDNGGDKFIDYIVDGIDTQIIIDALKVSLKKAYGAESDE